MAAVALIKITQGPNTDTGGVAVIGTLTDGNVVITNADNTNVVSWKIEILDVPPGSAIATGILSQATSTTPSGNMGTPDKPGSYRIRLTVTDSNGKSNVDIRVFTVRFARRGLIAPPYQKLPDPLPITGEGLPGEKPNELNFGGQAKGWSGDGDASRPLMYQLIKEVDDIIGVPDPGTNADGDVVQVDIRTFKDPIKVLQARGFNWVIESGLSDTVNFIPGTTKFAVGTYGSIERANLTAPGRVLLDTIYDGVGYLWSATTDVAAFDGWIYKITPGNPTTAVGYQINSAQGCWYLASAQGFFWATSTVGVFKFNPNNPVGPYTPISLPSAFVIEYDSASAAYGDGEGRLWVANTVTPGTISRIKPSTLTIDATIPMPVTNTGSPNTVALGGGYVWTVAEDSGLKTIYRLSKQPAGISTSSTSIDAVFAGGTVGDVIYHQTLNKVFVVGDSGGSVKIARLDPSTLVVEASATIIANQPYSTAFYVPRLNIFYGTSSDASYIWVQNLNGASSKVMRVDPNTLAALEIIPFRDIIIGNLSAIKGKQIVNAPVASADILQYDGASGTLSFGQLGTAFVDNPGQDMSSPGGGWSGTSRVVRCKTATGAIAASIPSSVGRGVFITFVDVDGQAAVNNITITPTGGATINGAANLVIAANRQAVTLYLPPGGLVTDWSIV